MAQKTAVEWLVEQLKEYDFADIKDNEYYIIKIPTWILKEKEIQALEMEKKQIKNAFNKGFSTLKWDKSKENKAEQHYDENFKSNQNETETN